MPIEAHQQRAAQILRDAGIMPVITVDSVDQGLRIADALLEGGLNTLELTLRTPAALDALAALKKALPDIVIGAGTVLSEAHIRQSIDAGADFLVTPGTPPALAEALARAPVPVIPGGASPTEFLALAAHGFHVCKLFPASAVGGIAMLKGLAGPLPALRLCPTGGIGEDSAPEFLKQPNVLCIGGSWMVSAQWLKDGVFDKVRDSAAKARAIIDAVGAARS